MCRKIVITSGKGGVGKTTLVAHLGAALARANLKVLLMDTDIGLNNLDVVCGVENKIVYDIVDVIEGRCRAKQALIQINELPHLYVLPSVHSYDKSAVSGQNIKMVLDRLPGSFYYIFINCPPRIERGFYRSVGAGVGALVVF
ncbi:MAG: AAA family ATPase [Firmicutes bacterium]|nr:AAA family ATPase [Bacillota bacterium]